MNERSLSGRPIFAVVSVVVVLLAGGLGFVVGATGQERGTTMDVLGVTLFEMTPTAMALFGVLVTAAVLTLLFGLVSFASRYDSERTT